MAFGSHDLEAVTAIVRAAAREIVMPRFRAGAFAVREKTSRLDLVSEVDEAAEAFIDAALAARYPRAHIVGEEAFEADPGLLDGIAAADLAFLIDPIDGTKNFVAGLPLFGCMLGVVEAGVVSAGVIYFPVTDDWITASRGQGAWLHRGDDKTPLGVASSRPLAESAGIVSWMFLPEARRSHVAAAMTATAGAVDYRCAAYSYRLLAQGHYDYALFGKTMPWDHAAGLLIHREAGGYAARFDGSAYLPHHRSGGLICATDEAAWQQLRACFLDAPGHEA